MLEILPSAVSQENKMKIMHITKERKYFFIEEHVTT
jgi:hypothetical protein